MTDLATVQKALSKTKIALMSSPDSAFFTTVAFGLKHEFDDRIRTACTNGYWIKYSPDFFMKQEPDQRVGLMLHETFHVIFNHMGRLLGKDMTKWNFATDYVINLMLVERGFKLPKGALLDYQYKGLSAEEVYDLLPDPDPSEEDTHFVMGDGTSGGTGSDPAQAPTEAQAKELQEHIDNILIRAQIQSKMAGDKPGAIPGEIELYLENLLSPKLPTAVLLKKFVDSTAKNGYSWKRPIRRHFPDHLLPSLYSEALEHLAVAVDASGSVSDSDFKRYVSEVAGAFRTVKPKKISLITFDTRIQQVNEVRNIGELSRITFHGRGGTAIRPVLDWANENKPKVMLIFSDGHFYFHEDTPKVKTPLLWCIHDNERFKAPMGKVVHFSMG